MLAPFISMEKTALKRPRLGPPDLYPQDPKQKEDELTNVNVKQGFSYNPQLSDAEFGSACKYSISATTIGKYLSSILNKKQDLNILPDTTRKRHQINTKDNWAVTGRSKNAIEAWFKDLAGDKSLTLLAKKVPIYNKKEDIFMTLCEYDVPFMRASWFIKMTSAHSAAISESKAKKRQIPDPSQEWTQILTKYLKEQLQKLQDTSQFVNNTSIGADNELALKLWKYCIRLGKHMYEEGLLDKQDFLSWILDILEKYQNADDNVLKFLLPLVLEYLPEFMSCELLARKLCYYCSSKLMRILNDTPLSVVSKSISNAPTNRCLLEYFSCPHHQNIIWIFSAIIQVTVLECSTALIWHDFPEERISPYLNYSPLDLLSVPPSCLPMPVLSDNNRIRDILKIAEHAIKLRSTAVENKWSCDKFQDVSSGSNVLKILNTLDALDRHNFNKVDHNNSLETLYSKIFGSSTQGGIIDELLDNETIIYILCEWAVCTQRSGEHRAMIVSRLIEKRQNELLLNNDFADEKDSACSNNGLCSILPMFQKVFMKYLDNSAPILDMNSSVKTKSAFANLILLFHELILRDVFSHDAYMRTLISRGDIINSHMSISRSSFTNNDIQKEAFEMDDSKIDADLDKLLKHIQQQNTMVNIFNELVLFSEDYTKDNPDSPKDEPVSVFSNVSNLDENLNERTYIKCNSARHILYTTHFPIPQNEYNNHENNQRYVLLYGFGKPRDSVKKVTKEITKLFNKKFSIDISDGKVKKHTKSEFNFEAVIQKFQNLSYYDQHVITECTASYVIEMLSTFSCGNGNYLPVIEHISFLFDLFQISLNINGLLNFCLQILKDLPDIELQLMQKCSNLLKTYVSLLSLYTLGVLRRYHCCLLTSPENTLIVFDSFLKLVKSAVLNPCEISSAERCILAYLIDLHSSCNFIKSRHYDALLSSFSKVKQILFAPIQPSKTDLRWNIEFMSEYISNPKKKIDFVQMRQLNENAASRYSFVCNAVVAICNEIDVERLNDISVLCAEATSLCNSLAPEWLGVLTALCCLSTRSFMDVQTQVDIADFSIHKNLAVFTSIMVARHCFSLQDFVVHVALPSLVKAWNEGLGDSEAEPRARLTCQLLLHLLKPLDHQHIYKYISSSSSHILYGCDSNLILASHINIEIGAVLAILKAILVLIDSIQTDGKSKEQMKHLHNELSISDILGTNDRIGIIESSSVDSSISIGLKGSVGIETASLSEFAKHVLVQICSQEWIRDKCLQKPEDLCSSEMLLDKTLKPKQAQKLLYMICHPENPSPLEELVGQKSILSNIFENLNQWTLCISWLNLDLMDKQYSSSLSLEKEHIHFQNTVAEFIIQLFQGNNILEDNVLSRNSQSRNENSKSKQNSVWLIVPLVAKLSSEIQSKVLWVANNILETTANLNKSKEKIGEKNVSKQTVLIHYHPFISLIQTCLETQDTLKDDFLSSLKNQLEKFLHIGKENKLQCDSWKSKHSILNALKLRFNLIGWLFESIQKTVTSIAEWALVLAQLICSGIIDLNNNRELFFTLIDMLCILLHSTLMTDSVSTNGEENKKQYLNLVKKLKKEICERNTISVNYFRQLLPLSKKYTEAIACEPIGTLTDTKGNKIQGFDSIDKKQGLQVSGKQKISPWEILEGHKNPTPLSWAWFHAIKSEKKRLTYEEAFRLQLYHTHSMWKPETYFLEPPPLPPEELKSPPEKQIKEDENVKHSEISNSNQNIKGSVTKKTKQPKKKKIRATNGQNLINQSPMHLNYSANIYHQGTNWNFAQSQNPYCGQPASQLSNARLERCNAQSKEAISQMLRNRTTSQHPGPQFMNPTINTSSSFPNVTRGLRPQIVRGGMANISRPNVQNLYGVQQNLNPLYSLPQTNAMGQNFQNMSSTSFVAQNQPSLLGQNYNQSNYANQGSILGITTPQNNSFLPRGNIALSQPSQAVTQRGITTGQFNIGQNQQQLQYNQRPSTAQQIQQLRQQMMLQSQANQVSQQSTTIQPQNQNQQSAAVLVAQLQRSLSANQPQINSVSQQLNPTLPQQHNPYHPQFS